MTTCFYLDTSVYNRPFDDQTQPRIWLETLALSLILQLIEDNEAELITSTVVAYENSRNPHEMRRIWVNKVAQLASHNQPVDPTIRQRAATLENEGLKAIDALHLACAEAAAADYFITCDDRLISRYQRLQSSPAQLTVCNPTEFIRLIGA